MYYYALFQLVDSSERRHSPAYRNGVLDVVVEDVEHESGVPDVSVRQPYVTSSSHSGTHHNTYDSMSIGPGE